jgi:NAD-dependent SIR2 family protein deacetylase
MSRTVFILGAGASKQAGVPLMADFLDVAYELRRKSDSLNDRASFDAVFKGIQALQGVFAKSYLNLTNVESVFTAFEMGRLLHRLGDLDPQEIEAAPQHMRKLILATITETTLFPTSNGKVSPPPPYVEFVSLLHELRRSGNDCSVITFNYDLALDYAFHNFGIDVEYGLGDRESRRGFPFLKLHGSLNWAKCLACHKIVPWNLSDFFSIRSWRSFHMPKAVHLNVVDQLSTYSHCGQTVDPDPLIVPPTWNKTQYHQEIADVWRAAADELSSAENLVICGYSLPPTDVFFHQLFAIGTTGKTRLRRLWVFNPDPGVRPRFENLLGAAARERFLFEPYAFAEAIAFLRQELVDQNRSSPSDES